MFALAGGAHEVDYPAATLYGHLGQLGALRRDGRRRRLLRRRGHGSCGEPEVNEVLGPLDCEGTTACDAALGFDGPAGVGTPNGLAAFGAPPPPTVVTLPAGEMPTTAATLEGTVDPNGAAVTSCAFEWGTTTAYGSAVPCASSPGSGSTPVAVSARLEGLASGTRYYFRVSAGNETGTATGKKGN